MKDEKKEKLTSTFQFYLFNHRDQKKISRIKPEIRHNMFYR